MYKLDSGCVVSCAARWNMGFTAPW